MTPNGNAPSAGSDGYLFCFWNMENFFDDKEDGRKGPDKEYDEWFANDKKALQEKLDHLSSALMKMNDGRTSSQASWRAAALPSC